MRALIVSLIAIFFFGACSTMQVRSPAVSILVDLDPASVDRTVIVESITADKEVITYCTVGGRSCHTWFVLTHLLGYPNVREYEASWYEWGRLLGAPIEK